MDAETRTVLYVGAGAGLAFVLWKWRTPVVAAEIAVGYVSNIVGRGNRLSDSTVVDGVVQEIPEVLQDQASAVLGFTADPDTLALARMGRSEGVDGEEYRMHVALNDLANLQRVYGSNVYSSLLALMIHSKNAAADGHFSEQGLGKRYATTRDPYESDYALAQKVLQDRAEGIDPTGGALKFVDKSSFAVQAGASTYASRVEAWAKEGLAPQTLPDATDNFVVFVPVA